MNRVAQFEKVSYEQFRKDFMSCIREYDTIPHEFRVCEEESDMQLTIEELYNNIKLPKRATTCSAGYDFFIPFTYTLEPGKSIRIPTGIRCKINYGWTLEVYPRSGMGFKTGVHLANTVGIIDGDYYQSDNEGHIFVKLVNDSDIAKTIKLNCNEAFCQGLFKEFGITYDDFVTDKRNGGFGSTTIKH